MLQHFPRDDDVKCRSSIFKDRENGDDVPMPMSINVCAEHNDHDLKSEEYSCSLKRSGEMSKNISPAVIYQLVRLHETESSLPIATIRYLLDLQ